MSIPFMSLAAATGFGALVSSASAEAIVNQRELSLDAARAIVDAAIAHCREVISMSR